MTLATSNNKVSYVSSGTETLYDFGFPALSVDFIKVFINNVEQGSGFTVTLDPSGTGGTVVLSAPAPAGDSVVILRGVPLTQDIDYNPYGPFPSETHERGLDLGVARDQQLQEQLNRSLKFPVGSGVNGRINASPNDVLVVNPDGSVGGIPLGDFAPDSAAQLKLDLANNADPTKGAALVGGASRAYNTVAEMITNLQSVDISSIVGSSVCWLGYYSQLDGGGNVGVIKSGSHTKDGGSVFSINASTYVEANHGDVINGKRFGFNGSGDLIKLQAAIDYANGRTIDISSCGNLSGTISGAQSISLRGEPNKSVTLSGLLEFDNTNVDLALENVHFDATAVPNGTSVAVLVKCSGHFECINSDCRNAPRGNMQVNKVNTLTGWGGDFSNAGRENYTTTGGVNIGVGLHIYGVVTRGRWYNPKANGCWQIGVFINGTGTDICRDTIVYNAQVDGSNDNGIRCQPEDAAYLGVQDSGFVNPIVNGSRIDNIRINGTRCFCDGGRSTNATGWACKTDGGTDIVMRGIYARGNGSGIGGRITVDLNGLTISDCDTDGPASTPAIYCVQVTSGKAMNDVKMLKNTTKGGAQADLAIILATKADGARFNASGNVYTGTSTSNYREVFGNLNGARSVNNSAVSGGGVRAFTNLSACDNALVVDFNGFSPGSTLWGIEANNGTTTSRVAKSAYLGISSTIIGGSASAGVTGAGGNLS